MDFWLDFVLLFVPRKKAQRNPPNNPLQNSPGNSFGKLRFGYLQKPQKPSLEIYYKNMGMHL